MKINIPSLKFEIIFVILIVFLFLGTRLYKISETPVYPDEITWMVRAKETALAIKTGNINFFNTAWWNIKDDTEAIGLPLSIISGFPLIYLGKGQSVVSRNIFQDYIVARGSIIIFSTIFIIIFYVVSKKLFNSRVAFFATALLVLDPIFTANTKIVMNDIFLTVFTFIAIFAYLLVPNRKTSILISSLATALAFLTKPNGLIVIPILFVQMFINRNDWKNEFVKYSLFIIGTLFFISVFWPASWNNILFAIPEYIYREKDLVGVGINNYFFGKLTENPPISYYLFEILVRLPPLIVVGFISFLLTKKNWLVNKYNPLIILFILSFLLIISFSAKKLGVRYALPVWPFIYLIVSSQIIYIVGILKNKYLELISLILAITWFLFVFVQYFPYHGLYYNQFVGGTKNSRIYDLVGLCEGSKAAVDYIFKCYPKQETIGAVGCGNSSIPYYYPYKFTSSWKDQKIFYVEAYYIQLQKDLDLNIFFKQNLPVKIIEINGVEMAYIYADENINNTCE